MIDPTDKQLSDLLWEWVLWKETGERRPILRYFLNNGDGRLDFTEPYYRAHKKK